MVQIKRALRKVELRREHHQIFPWYAVAATLAAAVPLLGGQWVVNLKGRCSSSHKFIERPQCGILNELMIEFSYKELERQTNFTWE